MVVFYGVAENGEGFRGFFQQVFCFSPFDAEVRGEEGEDNGDDLGGLEGSDTGHHVELL